FIISLMMIGCAEDQKISKAPSKTAAPGSETLDAETAPFGDEEPETGNSEVEDEDDEKEEEESEEDEDEDETDMFDEDAERAAEEFKNEGAGGLLGGLLGGAGGLGGLLGGAGGAG